MNVDDYPDHLKRPPDVVIPIQPDPEREGEPLPDDTTFVDHQLRMWAGSPVYKLNLRGKILAETSPDPGKRPGESPLAKKWESHLAAIANNTEYDIESLEGDPYEKVFAAAREHTVDDPEKLSAIIKIERLYKRREAAMNTKQQYEVPLPKESHLLTVLRMILEQD